MPKLQELKPGTPLPRVAIYHGKKDANIPAATSAIPLSEALKRAGGEVKLELFEDVEHNVYAMGKSIEERLKAFFAAHL
jgi:dipeptidyl aminopeptidase/acylaminoacyl peptidase